MYLSPWLFISSLKSSYLVWGCPVQASICGLWPAAFFALSLAWSCLSNDRQSALHVVFVQYIHHIWNIRQKMLCYVCDSGVWYGAKYSDCNPFAVGMVPFAGVPLREHPWFLCVCRLNPASSMNTQFLQKSKLRVAFHSSTFSFRKATTRSEFLAAVNFSSFFSVSLQFCTKCRCNAEIDIVSPGNASQRWCLISESTAAGCSSMYSTRKT